LSKKLADLMAQIKVATEIKEKLEKEISVIKEDVKQIEIKWKKEKKEKDKLEDGKERV
jgi:hypothetical protein